MKKRNYISIGLGVAFMSFICVGAIYSSQNAAQAVIGNTAEVQKQAVAVGNNSAAWLFDSIFQTVLQNL